MKRPAIRATLIAVFFLIGKTQFSDAFAQIVEIPTINVSWSPTTVRLEINRSRRQVTLFRGETRMKTYPVAIGRPGWETPTGKYRIFQMRQNPAWRHPLSGEIFAADDAHNELGHYWIGFCSKDNGLIGFHDTPHPETVGQPVSHGCIRMFEKDIANLFREVRMGTLVTVLP